MIFIFKLCAIDIGAKLMEAPVSKINSDKPSKRNKVQNPNKADAICDTGASISLAPMAIAQNLKMKTDRSTWSL